MTIRTIVKSALRRKVETALEVSIAVLFVAAMVYGCTSITTFAQTPEVQYVMPQIPDEAAKVRALKRAYHLNGGSMVGSRMIDLTKDQTAADPMPQHPGAAAKIIATPQKRQ
jgi:hypothetical protein